MLLTLLAAHPRGTHPFPGQDPVKLGGVFWNGKPGGALGPFRHASRAILGREVGL